MFTVVLIRIQDQYTELRTQGKIQTIKDEQGASISVNAFTEARPNNTLKPEAKYSMPKLND